MVLMMLESQCVNERYEMPGQSQGTISCIGDSIADSTEGYVEVIDAAGLRVGALGAWWVRRNMQATTPYTNITTRRKLIKCFSFLHDSAYISNPHVIIFCWLSIRHMFRL